MVKMQFPYSEDSFYWDGTEHEIEAMTFEQIEESEYYYLTGYDLTYKIEMVSLLKKINDDFFNVPLDNYMEFASCISQVKLNPKDISLLPSRIGLAISMKVEELKDEINKGLEKFILAEPKIKNMQELIEEFEKVNPGVEFSSDDTNPVLYSELPLKDLKLPEGIVYDENYDLIYIDNGFMFTIDKLEKEENKEETKDSENEENSNTDFILINDSTDFILLNDKDKKQELRVINNNQGKQELRVLNNEKNELVESIEKTNTNKAQILEFKPNKKDTGRIFTDEERIDPAHRYLTVSNAKNLGYLDEKDYEPAKMPEPKTAFGKKVAEMKDKWYDFTTQFAETEEQRERRLDRDARKHEIASKIFEAVSNFFYDTIYGEEFENFDEYLYEDDGIVNGFEIDEEPRVIKGFESSDYEARANDMVKAMVTNEIDVNGNEIVDLIEDKGGKHIA